MAPVMCYICGREFGSRSISIHIPQCKKKWEAAQSKLPKSQRRPVPEEPSNLEQIIKGEVSAEQIKEYNDRAFDDFNKQALSPCPNCARTFLPRSLEVHLRSCKPNRSPSPSKLPQPTNRTRTGTRKTSPQPPQQQSRPGTYVKAKAASAEEEARPTRTDLARMVEREAALEDADNRRRVADFIRSLANED